MSGPPPQNDGTGSHRIALIPAPAAVFGLLSIVSAVLGLIGMALNITLLSSVYPGYKTIAVSASLLWIVTGTILSINAVRPLHGWAEVAGKVILGAIIAVEAFELPLSLLGTHSSIETRLTGLGGTVFGTVSTPISPVASILIIIVAAALIFLIGVPAISSGNRRGRSAAGIAGSVVSLVSFTFVASYLFGDPLLYGTQVIPIAALSALAAFFMGTGLVAASGPDAVPLRYITGTSTRALLLRTFIPLTVAIVLIQQVVFSLLSSDRPGHTAVLLAECLVLFVLATGYVVSRISGRIGGALDRAEQALVRKNEELSELNEELTAADEELRQNIAELSRNEQNLRASETRYKTVADFTLDWEFWFDPDGRFLYVSPSADQILGRPAGRYSSAESFFRECVHPEDFPARLTHLKDELAGKGPLELEFRIVRPDGEVRWIHHVCRPIRDAEGKFLGTRGSNRDITERRQAEEALRESEERFRVIAETSPILLSVSGIQDGTVFFINNAYEQAFGFDRGEFIGKKAANVYCDDADREAIIDILKREGEVRNREVRVRHRDGTSFWVESSVTRVRFGGKDAMLGASVDITRRRQAEEALRESHTRITAILESIADTFYSLDDQWRFMTVNPAAEKAPFGRPALELLGKVIWDLYPNLVGTRIHRRYLDAAKYDTLEHYEAQSPLNGRWYEVFMQGRNGGVDVYMRDITGRRQAEEDLRRARDDLEVRVEERTAELNQATVYTRSLIEASLDPLVTINPDGTISDVNAATASVTGFSRDELIGTDFSDYFTDPAKAKEGYETVFRNGFVRDYPLGLRHRDGGITHVLYNATVYYDESGKVAGVFAAARDISTLKKAEEKITQAHNETRLERQRLYDVLETLPVYVCLLDKDYKMPFANRYFRETFGYSLIRPCYEFLFKRMEPCENCDSYTVMKTRAPHHWYWTGPNGRNYSIYDYPFTDTEGSMLILEMGIDITEQRQAEEALRKANEVLEQRVAERTAALAGSNEELRAANEELAAAHEELNQNIEKLTKSEELLRQKASELTEALAEKEMLLSEIHHRVKNNLTAFISLLSLEGSYEESEAGKQLKKDLQNRARSMALIHETLYRTKKYSHVDMGMYLTTLIGQITTSYTTRRDVHVTVSAGGMILDLARATPCGLIINELVTNAFKYAFPAGYDCASIRGEPCTIRISLQIVDATYRLIVSDNGVGLPEGVNLATAKSLGLKLVNFLARHQLGATIIVDTSVGTSIEFQFRKDPARA